MYPLQVKDNLFIQRNLRILTCLDSQCGFVMKSTAKSLQLHSFFVCHLGAANWLNKLKDTLWVCMSHPFHITDKFPDIMQSYFHMLPHSTFSSCCRVVDSFGTVSWMFRQAPVDADVKTGIPGLK